MPRIHIDEYDDWDELESELPSHERISRRPKEDRYADHTIKPGHKHNPDAAKRKEFQEGE